MRCAFLMPRDMAVFLFTTYLHITSTTSLSWFYLRIAFHSKPLFPTTTNPHIASIIRRYGIVSHDNKPSHHPHHQEIWHRFPLQLTFTSPPSHCFSQQAPTRCACICQEIWHCFPQQLTFTSLSSPRDMAFFPLQLTFTSPQTQVGLQFSFALLLTASAFTPRFFLPRDMAVFFTTTYLHINFITSLSWIYFRIAFHSKRLYAAPCFCQEICQFFSL